MNQLKIVLAVTANFFSTYFGKVVKAEETLLEKANIVTEKTTNSVKKTVKKVQDKGCELVDGKMQCLGKKIKHKVEALSEDAATKVKEIKNK